MQILGLMSGTSLDAVDAAVCEFAPDLTGNGDLTLRLLGYLELPFPPALREELLQCFRTGAIRLDALAELNFELGEVFAEAANRGIHDVGARGAHVDLIASHGQTIYHSSSRSGIRSTLQLGEPTVIAQRTGLTVVADFRTADVAAGGHGAPLASYFDAAVFGDAHHSTAVQNIGGIGNVTFISADSSPQRIVAFDTGPGNALIDFGARHFSHGTRLCDIDGAMADAGTPHQELLTKALAHPYFSQPPPKTTGREVFGDTYAEEFIRRALALGLTAEDTMATLTALTAESIARSYRDFGPASIRQVIASGGGVRNPVLMRQLRTLLPEMQFHTLDDLGFPADAKEAAAFALLGYEAIHGRPTNLPGCTGAMHPAILGKIVPGSNYRALLELIGGRKAPTPQPLEQGERAPWPPIRKVRLLH